MTTTDAKRRIYQYIVEKFPLARKRNIGNHDSLLETGVLDSLGILDLVHFLETEFGFQVADEELLPENFQSVDSISVFVTEKTSAER
jgi:acyl carrier protein